LGEFTRPGGDENPVLHQADSARWLFIGQFAASAGFLVYSALMKDWVFVTTNAVLLLNAIVGAFLVARNAQRVPSP
jgi:MtN3 and saliva related transmembrane protein